MSEQPLSLSITELKRAVDDEMKGFLARELLPEYPELHEIMTYHLGWNDMDQPGEKSGKRLRPIFLLLSAQAVGGNWREALPAAAGVELLHNFSLIHDDIQDQSPLRHGRPSVWKKWGLPLAINAGDTMFSLAHLALLELTTTRNPEIALKNEQVLLKTCVQLTYGQHLDISNEKKDEIEIQEYLTMIEGKTAVLIGAAMMMGVITAGGDDAIQELAYQFGKSIGMAFQVTDDILGIWGETALTGKSNEGDLMSRKLSLPILYGIKQNKEFARRWRKRSFSQADIAELAKILAEEGAREYAQAAAAEYTEKAMQVFDKIGFINPAAVQIKELCRQLISRKS